MDTYPHCVSGLLAKRPAAASGGAGNSPPMRVILGVPSLKAYVTAPKAFHVLGIVRFGMEYGLLATDATGLYFRVNGSHSEVLDSVQVCRAIDFAYGLSVRLAATSCAPPSPDRPARVCTVTYRRKRTRVQQYMSLAVSNPNLDSV